MYVDANTKGLRLGEPEKKMGWKGSDTRSVYFDGQWIDTPVFSADDLVAGTTVPGPSIVEYADACAVLPPGCGGKIDEMGNLTINIGD